jgi:hypothetical protein
MATQQEIPIGDDELDALMAELEIESGGMVAASAPVPAALVDPIPGDQEVAEMAALEAELEAVESRPKEPKTDLQFFVDVAKFRDETKVAEHNLHDCMMQQSGLRADYGEQAARAEAQYLRLKARFEVLEAQLYDQHRKVLVRVGEKVTEKQVENNVKLDPKWLDNKNIVIEAETIAAINKSLVESLKDRRDMIIQLGTAPQGEDKGAARILAPESPHSDAKARALNAAS